MVSTGVPFEGLQIGGEQDALFLHAALYTQDGRYVAGIDGEPVTFESTRNVQLGSLISAEGEMDAEADEPFRLTCKAEPQTPRFSGRYSSSDSHVERTQRQCRIHRHRALASSAE